jgi:RNA recognition motif-containing protein
LNACSTQESQTDAGAPPLKKAKTENGAVPAGGDAAEGTTVFVGGCSYDADEAAFRDFFKDCGEIKTVRIPTFQDSGKPRGIAFIEFDSAEAAQKACEFNDAEMMGRYLKVSVSTSTNKGNQDRAPRSQELSAKPEGRLAVAVFGCTRRFSVVGVVQAAKPSSWATCRGRRLRRTCVRRSRAAAPSATCALPWIAIRASPRGESAATFRGVSVKPDLDVLCAAQFRSR